MVRKARGPILNWHQLFSEPQLAKALYGNEFALVDLTIMPDNQIMQHQRVAMLELLQNIFGNAIWASYWINSLRS